MPRPVSLQILGWAVRHAVAPATAGAGAVATSRYIKSRKRRRRRVPESVEELAKEVDKLKTAAAATGSGVISIDPTLALVLSQGQMVKEAGAISNLFKAPFRLAAMPLKAGIAAGRGGVGLVRGTANLATGLAKVPFAAAHGTVRALPAAVRYGIPAAAVLAPPALLLAGMYRWSKNYKRDPVMDAAYD